MNDTFCESELSCSDSPLSITSNIVGILTFAYALTLGTSILATQLRGSAAEIKRFGKAVAFLNPRIDQLRRTFAPDSNVTAEAAQSLSLRLRPTSNGAAELASMGADERQRHKDFDIRLTTLISDFQPLLESTIYLWSEVEVKEKLEFKVDSGRRIWWLWNSANVKTRLSEVEARFIELLSYAEKK